MLVVMAFVGNANVPTHTVFRRADGSRIISVLGGDGEKQRIVRLVTGNGQSYLARTGPGGHCANDCAIGRIACQNRSTGSHVCTDPTVGEKEPPGRKVDVRFGAARRSESSHPCRLRLAERCSTNRQPPGHLDATTDVLR